MMIEREIEQAVAGQIRSMLTQAGINTVQVSGHFDNNCGEEDGTKEGYIIVKASPRQYQTPTVPECQVTVRVAMTVRADVDWDGKTYLDLFELLMGTFERWQKCMSDVHTIFNFPDFYIQGYVLNSGDTSMDAQKKVWAYAHEMTFYGVIQP